MPRTLIVNYGAGNVSSVERSVVRLGYDCFRSGDPSDVDLCDKLILAGVGHFDTAMKNLRATGLGDALTKAVMVEKKPVLGICLGMELMALTSMEGDMPGLGWIDAHNLKLEALPGTKQKVPHIGWNPVWHNGESRLMDQIPDGSEFYFLHSYYMRPMNGLAILSDSDYHGRFPAVIAQDNIYGVQFHPEKSHGVGQRLIKNFLDL
jgi:glutamine amidotransferase